MTARAHLGQVRAALAGPEAADPKALRRSLEDALAREPRRGDLHLARGLLLLYRDQDFEAARLAFAHARELLGSSAETAELRAEARFEEARALELLGREGEARAAAGAALAGFAEGSVRAGMAAMLLARLEASRGELDLAFNAHKRARAFYASDAGPGLAEFHGFNAWLAEKRRDPRAWVRAMHDLVALEDGDARSGSDRAMRLVSRKGPTKRVRRLVRLLRRLEKALLMAEEGGWADGDARADLAATLTFEGLLLQLLRRPQRALKKLRRAIARDPGETANPAMRALAHQLAGRCLLARNRPVAATARLTRAAELSPRPDVLLDLARARELAGDLDGARATLEKLVLVEPRPAVHERIGRTSEAAGDKVKALEAYLEVARDRRRERAVAARIGLLLADLGRDDEARRWLDRALRVSAGDPELLVSRGRVLARLGRGERAYRDLARAVEALESSKNPGDAELLAEARFQEGSVLLKLGRPAEALAAIERCLAIAPDREDALLLKGDCARGLGRVQEAIEIWKEVIDRKFGGKLLDDGVALYEQGRYVDALRKYREAFDRSPRGWEVFYRTAQAYAKLGESAPALKYLAIALKINRNVRMLLEKDPAVARLATAPELREALGDRPAS